MSPRGLAAPSVATHYGARLDLSDTVVVSVSQSGATAEIVETQEWARACGAATVGVTNVEGSPLADAADVALVTRAGPEVAVPATKSYLTQLVALAVLADALGEASLGDALDRVPGCRRASSCAPTSTRLPRRWPPPTGWSCRGAGCSSAPRWRRR